LFGVGGASRGQNASSLCDLPVPGLARLALVAVETVWVCI